jgi:hypothetical protein
MSVQILKCSFSQEIHEHIANQIRAFLQSSPESTFVMSGRVIRECLSSVRRVPIVLSERVQDRGFQRLIDAIDPAVITQTADAVAKAFNGSVMLTQDQKEQAAKILITYDPPQSKALEHTH